MRQPALQRRWASPRHLIVDALEDLGHVAYHHPADAEPSAETGATRAAGIAIAVGALADPGGRRFVRHMLFAAGDDPPMAHDVDRVLLQPLRSRLRTALGVGADAGPARAADRDAVVEMLQAAALAAVITGRPVDPAVLAVTVGAG